MCGGRLRFPFGNAGDDDVIVAVTPPRCLVCGYMLPQSATATCTRCDVPHVVRGQTATRAVDEPAAPQRIARIRAQLSSSPRARLLDAVLAKPGVNTTSIVAAEAFVVAEAALTWTPQRLQLPLSLARDVCEHLLLLRGNTIAVDMVAFTIVDGIACSLLDESTDASVLALVVAAGEHALELDDFGEDPGGDGPQRPCHGECELRALSSSWTSRRLRPVLHLPATANVVNALWMYLVGARVILARFHETLSLSRPAVLAWLTCAVLLGVAGRAPTVALSSALSSALPSVLASAQPSVADPVADGVWGLLQLPAQRFRPQDARR